MLIAARVRFRRSVNLVVLALAAALAASCTSTPPKSMVVKKPATKEYFPEAKYGVKASPRVSSKRTRLPRGGGRDQIGKPYMIAGKMYYPKEDKKYRRVGKASWYGDAFHGRLTANGEIYDMTHLTAAHPTMPLPSYARVTNTKNGASLIVRVNDRGPYANGRIIDLSKQAAELLDYTHVGTANVVVEYVGRAPLEGDDEPYLMASYRPGNRAPDPSDGLPTGVMIAMNGPTPTRTIGGQPAAVAFPGELKTVAFATTPTAVGAIDVILPDAGPIAPVRPIYELAQPGQTQIAMATMSYASERIEAASASLGAISDVLEPVASSWKRPNGDAADASGGEFIAAGTFGALDEASRLASALSAYGHTVIETADADGQVVYAVSLQPDGRYDLDAMLRAAWQHGAPDAISIRN